MGVNVAKAFNLLYRFPSGVLLYLIFERFGNCGLRSKIDRFVEGEVTEVGERELYVYASYIREYGGRPKQRILESAVSCCTQLYRRKVD